MAQTDLLMSRGVNVRLHDASQRAQRASRAITFENFQVLPVKGNHELDE